MAKSKSKTVPPAAAPMVGPRNPASLRAMPPKGKSSASNKGTGLLLRAQAKGTVRKK
jgi:hypothetical protein